MTLLQISSLLTSLRVPCGHQLTFYETAFIDRYFGCCADRGLPSILDRYSVRFSDFCFAHQFCDYGSDRTGRAILKAFQFCAAHSPERALRLAVRLDVFAMRWDGLLDCLPEGRVDALYLYDFQSRQVSDDQHQELVGDRLSRMQEKRLRICGLEIVIAGG